MLFSSAMGHYERPPAEPAPSQLVSAYEDAADALAEHCRETCDDPFCQICIEESDEAAEMQEFGQ